MFKKQPASTSKKSSTPKPSKTTQVGNDSERLAEQFLCEQGLKLVERNYRCKLGEIDLIMRDREHLVFVEVRYRKSTRYGSASETVDYRKQQKLIRAAQFYLQTKPKISVKSDDPACRFDVVAIHGATMAQYSSTNPPQKPIEWIPNAFMA